MDLLLGLDVGTTATKALLISTEGKAVASASHNYGLITLHEDWVEQNPEDLWQGVIVTTRAVLEHVKPEDQVIALSISAQGGTTIPVDADFHPVANAISWMDHRAHEQAEQIRSFLGEDRIYEISGWQVYDGLPLLHICWLRKNAPETFASARYFLFVNDFIIHRLTGHLCMDPSDAGITQLYNIAEGQWDKRMLEIAGIEPGQLSPVRNSGTVVDKLTAKAGMETGLSRSVLVVNGAHDQYCAALGAGVLQSGDVMLSCGTAWVILGVMERLKLDPKRLLSISPHVIPNKWGALRSMGAVGASMEWFLDNFPFNGDRHELYETLNRCVEEVSVGSKGLMFFPPSGGYGRGTRGGFIGLSISHSRSDMARSIMEGITYDLRWTTEDVQKAGIESKKLKMVGGAASSPIWPKIVADITHIPVTLPSTTQAASFGAAMLAGVGSGIFPSPVSAYQMLSGRETLLEPDQKNCNKYDELFEIYQTTFRQIADSLIRLSKFESNPDN